ncbi:hypothetical protein [Helicobacter sp. 12S02634-8]|nr:hypothetical protein [Helicobacter sp. 12S02634-8]
MDSIKLPLFLSFNFTMNFYTIKVLEYFVKIPSILVNSSKTINT